jgi:hypothetical protein
MLRKTALEGMAREVKVPGGTQYGQKVKAPPTHLVMRTELNWARYLRSKAVVLQ